jgi:superfamily II RNA helicase
MARTRRGGNQRRNRNKRPARPQKRAGEQARARRQFSKQRPGSKSSTTNASFGFQKPRRSDVKTLLEGIGAPEARAFAPDPFQIEALSKIEYEDVLVTAPTGAGKTWIAREEIRRLLAAGKRVWYASPLKALTNSKYHEFAEAFGAENVGILTGDRKENGDAPVIVGTTEIYRNQLFDALRGGEAVRADLVVMDEAHYLADEERGHVWEEAIILTPPRIRLLLLSATIGNAREFAAWIGEVRGTRCGVVTRCATNETNQARATNDSETNQMDAVSNDSSDENVLTDSSDEKMRDLSINLSDQKSSHRIASNARLSNFKSSDENSSKHLSSNVSRSKADSSGGVLSSSYSLDVARPVPLRAAFLASDGELAPLFDARGNFNTEIARWLQREQLTAQIFARANPRHGRDARRRAQMPDMPPSLLLAALSSYNLLPAIVFLPTRRRCDEAAMEAALAPLNRHENEETREKRLAARREMVREFVAQHAEVRRHHHIEMIVRGGVASHHAGHIPAWKLLIERLMSAGLLDAIFATATVAAGVDFPARTVALTGVEIRTGRGWRTLTASELQQMTGRAGRRGKDRVGFVVAASGAHQDPPRLAALLKSPPDPIESQFRATYTTLLNLLDAFGSFARVREIIERSFAHREAVAEIGRLKVRLRELETKFELDADERAQRKAHNIARRIETLRYAMWSPFEQLAHVLARFEYLDLETEQVTERGRWLADLRVDRPLLIGEALRHGLFDRLDAPRAAALIAALAADSERDYGALELSDAIVKTLADFEQIAFEVARVEWEEGLEVPSEPNFSAAATAARWASGAKWSDLVRETRAEEGDLFRMLARTGESLLQIARLRETHPRAAQIADEAAQRILREPVRDEEM